MASTPSTPRRGLPRVPGGEPWPPAGSDAPDEADPEGASAEVATGSLEAAAGSPGAVAGVSPDGADRAELRPGAARIAADSEDRPTDAAESGVAVASGAAAGVSQDGADLAQFRPGAARIAADSEDRPTDAADAVARADTASDPTAAPAAGPAAGPDTVTAESSTPAEARVRRGLPREPGGEPWPPASSDARTQDERPAAPEAGQRGEIGAAGGADSRPASTPGADPAARNESDAEPGASSTPPDAATTGFRRGLPRESGGEPWPPASAPVTTGRDVPPAAVAESAQGGVVAGAASPGPHPVGVSDLAATGSAATGARSTTPGEADAATRAAASTDPEQAARSAFERSTPRPPLTVPRTVWPGAAARRAASATAASTTAASATAAARPAGSPSAAAGRSAAPGATRLADFSPVQLLGSTAVLGVFALALVGIAVLLARFVLALEPGREFLAAYPGEYHLPESAPVGLPAWLNWSHFLNSFFLLFIIRTGWQVRNEKRPAAFWSPRKNKRRRISLTLWFHQAIDILWIANGVVFVVLLFTTGQWMRIVPTSWEVFPNALSAALQYASLDWPTENGWVNYNSLQQLSYFAITFVAAPLAIFSGVRLSGVWPKDAEKLNRLYPIEWARKVHFPTMLFFVAFIVVHVALVLATGALRNLNHMYAARGSVDPGAYTSDPTGLLIFAASLLVMAAGWVAARPRVLVPIARLFGDVKQR